MKVLKALAFVLLMLLGYSATVATKKLHQKSIRFTLKKSIRRSNTFTEKIP